MLTLQSGPLSAAIAPEVGAMVTALEWRAPDGQLRSLLRAPAGAVPSIAAPNRFGSWAMLPFANRAFDCVIDDGEQRFRVPANDPAGTGSIHGFGWQSDWEVLRYDHGHTVLEHRRSAGEDPYRYRARQEISLEDSGMTITLAIINEADVALPFGFGLHPWFPAAADTRLRMRSDGALILGNGFRATGSQPLADGGPYAASPLFATRAETAWSFLGWDGAARMETPSRGVAITVTASETLRCPVVWAPPGADFLCVEPQSHAIGSPSEAAARATSPLTRLQPGETLSGWMRIAVEAI